MPAAGYCTPRRCLVNHAQDPLMVELCKNRYSKELDWFQSNNPPHFKFIASDEKNRVWSFMFSPEAPPYESCYFHVSVLVPKEYPFKPPSVNFMTKIYHPNVDEAGSVGLGELRAEDWKPTLHIVEVLAKVYRLVVDLEASRPLRPELADQLASNPADFMQRAVEFTKKYAEKK